MLTPRTLKKPTVRRACRITDRKSTRLNSSHRTTSYAVFCLKKNIVTARYSSNGRPLALTSRLGRRFVAIGPHLLGAFPPPVAGGSYQLITVATRTAAIIAEP